MEKTRSVKQRLISAVLVLVMLVSSLVGTTFAWFTDEVTSAGNKIETGSLKVDLLHQVEENWVSLKDNPDHKVFDYDKWEPGYTTVEALKVANLGSLALRYRLSIEVADGTAVTGKNGEELADVIDVYVMYGESTAKSLDEITANHAWVHKGTLTEVMKDPASFMGGQLLPTGEVLNGTVTANTAVGSQMISIALHMQESAGNEYQELSVGDIYVNLLATQWSYENDSFGPDYDDKAEWPEIKNYDVMIDVTVENGAVKETTTVENVTVPAGVKVTAGTTQLGATVKEKESSDANLTLGYDETIKPLDVHVEGVAADNTVALIIALGEVMPKGLNIGNYTLYHVENDVSVAMTAVSAVAELDAHNEFYYDPATGEVTVAMATFSEVALVAEPAKWEGNRDYTWYNAEATELTIANADQLAAFGAIVGGMDYQTQDSFSDKTIKLIADINLGDKESENNSKIIFYPIGYYSSDGTYEKTNTAITSGFYTFEGTFDGNGHTIANFYQNTWEMKGDHNWYDATLQYYRDGMGLFGKVYGGTVKNLTVENFSSDGEIATTGVIAAYADGATFENIAIFNCNPRVYNIGNGGIVGCVGWYAKEADLKTTFKNITVDNSNTISALWGSWDVACGGIVGQYYPTSGQTSADSPVNAGIHFENCHVSAVMDVYNDVCANYQYYAYRYTGMLIGSVRENETINGHVYPKMDGITASGCTVHFGDWNDYYYCELVANTTASYTHDHQMSRLTQVASVDVENKTVTDLDGNTTTIPGGRVNYVVVKAKDDNGMWIHGDGADYATCYHFVDGAVWDHVEAGYHNGENGEKYVDENGDGEADLKEDKQLIYREFNQLFTGYGWGVTSKGLTDYDGVENMDITAGEHEASVEKFEGKVTELSNGIAIKLGDIFTFVDNGVELVPGALTVAVKNLDESNPVSATIVYDRTNWENGTITFTGTGEIKLTIQDYYFCTPTTITVNVTERQSVEKFEVVMNNGDFLHRVGNANTVALDKLFAAKANAEIGTVSVTVEALNGTAASGTYTSNATWTNGTIQFSGTGVVKVTITDNDYCTPTVLTLEVVDATNLISATGTTSGGTFVLLCDVNAANYVYYWNATLYGNGFTYSLNGAPTNYSSSHGHGILITKNATLDNLVIVGDVYDEYGAYTTNNDYNAAVDVLGDTTIQNCYISGCAAPVSTRANATITNTTLYGGTVGNLIIKSGTVTLEDVTTANYDDGRSLVGMGIVIHSDATESAKLVLNDTLTQYNFISESKKPSDSYAQKIHEAMFDSACSKYHFGTSPNRYVNAGIVSLTALFNAEDITDNANTGYVGTAVTVSSVNGYVYTQPNTSGSVNNGYDMETDPHVATTQGAVPPIYSFDYTNKNYQAKQDGSNDYCYEENGKVNISMDEGDTFNWDTSILTIGKGITSYTVSMNDTDYTGKSIVFDKADDYEVIYTYTDANNYKLDENGNVTTYSVTYTKTVNITVAVVEAATKHAEFTFGSSNAASTTVTIGNSTYVMPNESATNSTIGSTTVSGQTIYYPIVEIVMSDSQTSHTRAWYAYFPVFSGAVTITDYKDNGLGDAETFGSSTQSMPSGLSIVGDPAQLFKYQSSSAAGTSPVVKNNILVYSSPSISAKRSEYNTLIQYSYQDNAGATYYYYIGYHAPEQSYSNICVTPDTLVTLADGTQKRIDQVTYADQFLVWNFYTGEYAVVPAALIRNHGYEWNNIIKLTFSDGTVTKAVNEHGYFDATLNEFVMITSDNATDYIGHEFVKADGDSYTTVTLVNAEASYEYIEAYSILSAYYYNFITDNMFSLTSPVIETNFFMPFEVGENMTFDAEKMAEDIAEYGLYEYADFEGEIPYEVFEALNIKYLKVAVGKGLITRDQIVELLKSEGVV